MREAYGLSIPDPSLKRLPQYHHYLVELQSRGVNLVSCSVIGRDLKFVPVQVRKDLQFTGVVGKPKVGYSVVELVSAIESFLGWDVVNQAILVGVGNLGTAILGHERFSRFGLQVVAAFDTDPCKIGQTISGRSVLALQELADIAPKMGIHIGIITTPAEVAQAVADEMVRSGILAIWNFAPVKLNVSQDMIVHNEDLYSSLASLSCKLAKRLRAPIRESKRLN
ncbi:MAG: redox-sensing transcriptional repressor Rex [Terriglobales bacterium]